MLTHGGYENLNKERKIKEKKERKAKLEGNDSRPPISGDPIANGQSLYHDSNKQLETRTKPSCFSLWLKGLVYSIFPIHSRLPEIQF